MSGKDCVSQWINSKRRIYQSSWTMHVQPGILNHITFLAVKRLQTKYGISQEEIDMKSTTFPDPKSQCDKKSFSEPM